MPAGEYTVRVTITGYASVSRKVNVPAASPVTFNLGVSPYIVEETVTTARGHETVRNEIPGSVEVVTEDELLESVPVSLPSALAQKPGISVGNEMPWSGRTVIRGMSRDQVVMLVDGSRVVTATEVSAQYGLIPAADIERIEVLKGPLSVLYGSGSTGGVVNIITKSGHFTPGTKVDFSLNPSYESGANGVSSYERATVSGPRAYISLSQANRKYGDYYAAGGERIRNSQFQDRQTQVSVGFKLADNHTLEGRWQNFSAIDVGIPGGDSFPTNALASYPTTARRLYDLVWTWRPEARWLDETSVKVYHQPVDRDARLYPNAPSSVTPLSSDTSKSIRVTALDIQPDAVHNVYGFRWLNIMNLGSHNLVAGLEGWQKDMDSDRTKHILRETIASDTGDVIGDPVVMTIEEDPVPDSTQRPIGVFAEDTFSTGDRFTVTLGGRVDHIHTENDVSYMTRVPKTDTVMWDAYDDDDMSWSLVAGTVFKATDAVDLNLTVARSFRSPTIEERYLYANLGGIVTAGDPEIDPEKGTFVEAGVTAQLGSVRLNGQAYVNSIDDMVITSPGGDLKGTPVDYQYVNAGEALLRGFEAGAAWAVHPRLMFSTDISYTRGTDEKYDTDLPSMPPLTGHLRGRWSIGKGLWLEPAATFTDRQDKTAPGERETPGYGLLTVTAGKNLLRTGTVSHDLVLGLRNVFDKNYRDHLTASRGYELYGMGRSFFATWRITGN